ncbi:MAG: AAA family ATPase [Alphaproteobacteria bacterium]
MRFRRLDLSRYGHFTDYSVDFGERPSDVPDLHIIYGPNEAGKSTILASILDLLFGIERHSAYGFLHDYRSMRIGAALEVAGTTHELARIKKDQGSLLGEGDLPVSEAVLTSCLGAIDRQSYQSMFSLDDDTLEDGGDSILRSEGDLGRLLFSATSGLSELSGRLEELKAEADAFFRPRARTTELKALKEQLDLLVTRQKERDTQGKQFTELRQKAADAQSAYDEARSERNLTKVRHSGLRELLDAIPVAHQLNELRASLAPLRNLPDPPAGWAEEVVELSKKETSCKTIIDNGRTDVERLEGELEAMVVDQTILTWQDRIDRLKETEIGYRSAGDLSAREEERSRIDEQIAQVHERLGRPAVDDQRALLLPVDVVGGLRELIAAYSGLVAAGEVARKELAGAEDRHGEAVEALARAGAPIDATILQTLVDRHHGDGIDSKLQHLQSNRVKLAREIDEALLGLRPWQGDLEALAVLPVPDRGKVARWQKDQASVAQQQTLIREQRTDKEVERDRLVAELGRLKQRTGAIDDEHCLAARASRDRTWEAHRAALSKDQIDGDDARATADYFERAMADDDRLMTARSAQLRDLERLRSVGDLLAQTNADITSAGRRLEAVLQQTVEMVAASDNVLAAIGLTTGMELSDLERWLDRRDALLERRAVFLSLETEIAEIERACSEASARLADAIETAGESADRSSPLSEQVDQARRIIERAKTRDTEIAAAKRELERTETERKTRKRDLDTADQALLAWQDRWTALIADSWLGEKGRERTPGEVAEILQLLAELSAKVEKREDLDQQVNAMHHGKARFTETVRALATEAGEDFEEDRVLELADRLRHRLAQAREQERIAASKREDLERSRKRCREAEQELATIKTRSTAMSERFSAGDLDDLGQKLDQASIKVDLDRQIKACEQQLVERLKVSSLAAAESKIEAAIADDADIDRRQAELVELEALLDDQDERVTRLFHEREMADQAVSRIGGDGEIARLEEERQALLLDIEDRAERYLRLKIGSAAAEHALQLYRSRHQSSMMTRASHAFQRITGGRFDGLTTTPGKEGETLVGMLSTGGSQVATAMSKGTRFQLYLALRMAGFFEFVEQHEPLPFIADDIMETFDDDRSAETFKLLAGLAEKGQVIYLTHHTHLCDMARQVSGGRVQIHQLPSPAMKASTNIAAA